ncbi:efflux RND transporter permease subunit [Lignipirellula cremea]|uniref:MMPL family protein n=1 Tax=Lignipirellula cremea TaxID=2528010 RepID=A0A518DXQ8_9BACT|nr:MMPL family transporter [Lignipirellula cremea]QDU96614.1 MMPL family protein [Lignipirellula cremea]
MDLSQRRFRLAWLYGLALFPVIVWQAMQAVQVSENSPLDWAPADFPARVEYSQFADRFGPGDVVIMSWDDCTLDEPRLDNLVAVLRGSSAFYDGQQWLFDQVISGRELVQQLQKTGVDKSVAVQRLRGAMIGPDGAATCVIVRFTKAGLQQRARLTRLIQMAVQKYCGAKPSEQHLAGPVIDGLSVDVASAQALNQLAVPSSLVVFLVGLWSLGSWRATTIVFAVSLFCQAATLALISLCGDTMSALLIVLPPLTQVLALAGGIHMVNYYRAAAPGESAAAAASRAFRIGWLPCVLSAATTAIGMGSLMVSELTPIRAFGCYSAAGLLLTTALVLFLVPTMLAALRVPPAASPTRARQGWRLLTLFLSKRNQAVVGAFVLIIAVLGWNMSRLKTSVRIETLFGGESRVLADYRWLEDHVGPLVPLEVVVTFDPQHPASPWQRLAIVQQLEARLRECPQVGGSLSALTFAPAGLPLSGGPLPPGGADLLAPAEMQWTRMRLLSQSDGEQKWRVQGFVSALEQTDYAALLREVRSRLQEVVYEQPPGTEKFTIQATGVMPLVHEIQQQLLIDLRASFLLAFAIITVVMTIMQGSVSAGLVGMLPNIFPTVLMFGAIGWSGRSVDIGSVMTASVALGVAVDDTLHFLTHFQRRVEEGVSRRRAVRSALEHCGQAMLQSSVICAAGMAVFALSDFLPTARFAWMMVALLAAALLGDLILLPALLLGPLGKLWQPRTSQPKAVQELVEPQPVEAQPVDAASPIPPHHLRRASRDATRWETH